MDSTSSLSVPMECMAPLDDEDRRAVRRYWERVIREEWVPPERRVPRAVPLPEDSRRERREARRAVARIAAASRTVRMRALPSAAPRPATGDEVA